MITKIFTKLLTLSFLLLISNITNADEKALENALAKAQYMLRQVSAEKAQLTKEKVALNKEIAVLKKESDKKSKKTDKKNMVSTAKISKLTAMYEGLYGKHITLSKQYRQQMMNTDQLLENIQILADKHDLCIDNNQQLYSMNEDLARKFEKKGIFDVIKRHEPFTGIAKVKMENMLQGYEYDRDGLLISDLD